MNAIQTTQQLTGPMRPPTPTDDTVDTAIAGGLPTTLADFELHHELGRGGNAAVHLATVRATGQKVALKIIHGELAADPKYLGRFRREVRAASQIVHPHVCRVFCFGEEGSVLWLAMEVIEGGSIRELIERAGRLPPQVAAVLTGQLLDALQAAHTAGVLHRDIKPANAMVTSAGNLKLVDFGIAKARDDATVTETGFLVGTPAYMSPEQAVGREIDARTDLYAVGVSIYEMLLGENPYANDTPSQALLRIASDPLPSIFEQDPTVPGIVEAVFEHLTERRPEDRVASALEARTELQPYVDYVQLVHPTLLADFVADPIGITAMLRQEQSELEVARAERLLLAGDVNLPAAGLALYRAWCLRPVVEVASRFETVCGRGALQFGAIDDEEVARAREVWATSPTQAGPVKRVADLYRARGDIHRFVVFIRRYLRLRPADSHALRQLETCIAGGAVAPATTADGRLKTRDILAGVRTGGWAAVNDATKEAALALQQPTSGRRPATATLPATPVATQVVARATNKNLDASTAANERIRAAAAMRSVASATPDDGNPLLELWNSSGRRLVPLLVVVGALVLVVRLASRSVETSVDIAQVAVSDNTAAVGAIERNDIARRQGNMLKDATSHFNSGDHLKVILDVNRLLAANPPAEIALQGVLLRARSRVTLRQFDAARADFEAYIRQTPLSDPARTRAMDELHAMTDLRP